MFHKKNISDGLHLESGTVWSGNKDHWDKGINVLKTWLIEKTVVCKIKWYNFVYYTIKV